VSYDVSIVKYYHFGVCVCYLYLVIVKQKSCVYFYSNDFGLGGSSNWHFGEFCSFQVL